MARVAQAYGSWTSPITAERITAGSLRLSQPRLDGGALYWIEGRPTEGGRQVLMRAGRDGAAREVTPAGVNVRTRVHEYGGGDYAVRAGEVVYADDAETCVRRLGHGDPLTDGGARYADFEIHPGGGFVVAVEERHAATGLPTNRLVAIPLTGGVPLEIAAGHDFVSFPRFSPDGSRLVYTSWDHPDMPWDATELWCVGWGPDGPRERQRVAGEGESIFQPGFCADGHLTFVTDRSGWWNLEQWRDGARHPRCPLPAEFGRPQWVFGLATWAPLPEGRILCVRGEGGRTTLGILDRAGRLEDVALPFDAFDGVTTEGGTAAAIVASPSRAPAVGRLDLAAGRFVPVRESLGDPPDDARLAAAEAIEFATPDGEVSHAFLYRPTSPTHRGPDDARPPLLVKGHGGPTGAATSALQLGIQFWTSRGFAVVDVNYRGSTGFGRAYRERLRGEWGVVDVADCVAAARHLAERGEVDPSQLAISGGSAGGYTVLCALTFHDVFGAGASHYGIGDLEALARDTHKFEARYLDRLVGPYPERQDLYRARSPIHHAEGLACPVIFFQGLEDRVVPPSQAEAMVAVLAARGIPHAYVPFEGEQHGFRRAENQRTALEGELYFYARVFGFEVDVAPDGVALRGLG